MKTMYYKNIHLLVVLFMGLVVATSCEDYLDMAPEVEISDLDVFGEFNRYQGFVEEMYQCLPDVTRSRANIANWNWSNDVIGRRFQNLAARFETGDYQFWDMGQHSPFRGFDVPKNNNLPPSSPDRRRGTWEDGWYGIRVANKAIENIDMMVGTKAERDLILGQAYFFRAYFHFAIIAAWGGMPYINKAFTPNDKLDLPRLSYLESAKKIAEDFEKAISFLPASWDETEPGQRTSGQNAGRVTKGTAYAYLGKNWLYAASPLMNGVETGSYTYDVELAKKAAIAFNELLKLADQGYYGLLPWEDYHKNFWTMEAEMPRGKEFIWGNPVYGHKRQQYGEHLLQQHGGTNDGLQPPTLELVNKFGMANGLPIGEPDSGFDPNNPFANRDPRFDYTIVVDRERILFFTTAFPLDEFAGFHVGGRHRPQATTGFSQKKFHGKGANSRDGRWGNNYFYEVPYMRLAHAYLMYAEAANEGYGGPNGAAPGGITAVQAVNKVRNRAHVPNVDERFLLNKETFRETVRNEIGVEVSLESHQWYDYRRWYIAHLMENRTKSGLNYDQNWTYFEPFVDRVIEFDQNKHYWLPLRVAEASLYPEFYQNPGWD